MSIHYQGKRFKGISNDQSGEVGKETVFHYSQKGKIVWATYQGGDIQYGTITGLVREDDKLDFAYQHVNTSHEIKTGRCISTPEILPDGRIRLHEKWQWTSEPRSSGYSVIEEI